MDVDKILPFSSTLGWHSLNVNGEVQKRKGLRWIPRHPESRKCVASDEMLRGVENKHRSGDSHATHLTKFPILRPLPLSILLLTRLPPTQPDMLLPVLFSSSFADLCCCKHWKESYQLPPF